MIEKELRHKIRYYIQYIFLPELVQSVSDGYLPSIALFPSPLWYYNYRQKYDLEKLHTARVYERFERIDVDENHMLILYVFPQPQEMTEAVYGAVILNTVTSEAEYYTLESSVDDRWVIGHKTTNCHSNLGSLDSADQDKFLAWVMERAGYKLLH